MEWMVLCMAIRERIRENGLGPLFYVQSEYKAFKFVHPFGSMDKLSNPCPKMLQMASKCTFLLPRPLEPENTQKKHKELK